MYSRAVQLFEHIFPLAELVGSTARVGCQADFLFPPRVNILPESDENGSVSVPLEIIYVRHMT